MRTFRYNQNEPVVNFMMVSSEDHVTGITGLQAFDVYIAKNWDDPVALTGTRIFREIGAGCYAMQFDGPANLNFTGAVVFVIMDQTFQSDITIVAGQVEYLDMADVYNLFQNLFALLGTPPMGTFAGQLVSMSNAIDNVPAQTWNYALPPGRTLTAIGFPVEVTPAQVAQGVVQRLYASLPGDTLGPFKRGDTLPAAAIKYNFGSAYAMADTDIMRFCVKATQSPAATALIDVVCTPTDRANCAGDVPEIDLEAAGLAAGEYFYEFERRNAAGTKPLTPGGGKFLIAQDTR
ncbi:MAG: hypothetical protein OHK006_13170 [Thermodesulfovibrionales bacterium]